MDIDLGHIVKKIVPFLFCKAVTNTGLPEYDGNFD